MTTEKEKETCSPKWIEHIIGAFRHLIGRHTDKGFPVGFSIVFYKKGSETPWYYDMRIIGDAHDPSPMNRKVRERIKLVNQFLAEGIKRIFQGEHDDMAVDIKDRGVWHVPGVKGHD